MPNEKFTSLPVKDPAIEADEVIGIDSTKATNDPDKVVRMTMKAIGATIFKRASAIVSFVNIDDKLALGVAVAVHKLHVKTSDAFVARFHSTGASARIIVENAANSGFSFFKGPNSPADLLWTIASFIITQVPVATKFSLTWFNTQTANPEPVIMADGTTDFFGVKTTKPLSYLFSGGSFGLIANETIINKTLTKDHCITEIGTLSGTIVITLPSAIGIKGRFYYIKDKNGTVSATKTVTIDPVLSQTIDGLTAFVMNKPRGHILLVSDGANWMNLSTNHVVGKNHRTVTTSTTLGLNDDILGIGTLTAIMTVTLPDATFFKGKEFIINDEGGTVDSFNVTIARTSNQTIDRVAADKTMSLEDTVFRFYSDGANWFSW